MSKFAVFDIDGTVFRSSLYIEIVYELSKRGLIHLPEDTHNKAYTTWADRKTEGYATYRNKMVEVLESQITGLDVVAFEQAAQAVVDTHAERVYVYTRNLIRELKKQNYFLIALSGSQSQLVARFAKHWGFDESVGQIYHETNGKFTGSITKTHQHKELIIEPIIAQYDLDWQGSIAVGDTEGDIGLLEKAERAIAFNPNRALYERAVKSGWEIIVERKDMIYKLEPGIGRNYELVDTE